MELLVGLLVFIAIFWMGIYINNKEYDTKSIDGNM